MNRLCLVFGLFALVFASEAQTLYPRIGMTASVNTYRPADYDVNPRIGVLIGIGYNHTLSELISVQVELDYVQKSFETEFVNSSTIQYGDEIFALHVDNQDRYAISYLEMPLLMRARILHENFFVLGGVSLGVGLGGSHKYDHKRSASYFGETHAEGSGKIRFGEASSTNDENAYFDNRWDMGFHFGFGALFLKKFQVECRYGFGTINLYDNADSKNRCLQISLATPLKLK